MNMKKYVIIIITALTVFSLTAGAQAKKWSLQECIDYAVENSIALRQSRNAHLAGLEDTYQAKAAMFPTLSASTSQGITNRPFSESGNSTVVGSDVYSTSKATSWSGNYGLNAGMTLYSGGSLRTALKQSRLQNSVDSLSVEENTNDVVISIVKAYIQCLYASEAVKVSESTAEASKAQLDRAVELKNAGELSKVDVAQLESKGYNSMGMDQDNLIITPYTTVMKRILAITYLQEIVCSALSEEYTDKAIEEVSSVLRRNHKLKESDDDDFNIRSQQELSSMMTSTSDMMSTLLAAVAGISLLVGGIGIMNIMYVSVTERTKEIGLRMSIGAKGRDILAQFLIEATLISITGGLLGVILGVAASYIVKAVLSYPILIQPWSIVVSFLVCTIIGIFFGWYPARTASNLDPIEAIRYE